ncbi:MAG: T9SS type A sorting domain-containing protein [Flavobacteriaceae bacterium]|nr:T9SS type A sorting domain-containing protein [Bacteroidia bacterium]NND10013.1 T9SS type A sorting domain-containing protein [Flavobacteriaceae bacterium]NNF86223.1 T9SS type A sorting domain-containing protein [Winogradskyella sp.]
MRQYYTFILAFIVSSMAFGQTYDLGVVHVAGYDFKVVAVPDFDSAGDTDLSDVGFTLMLPAGASDVVNEASALTPRTWTVTEFDAAFLTGLGLGDGTRDAFQFNMPAGQSLFAHTMGQMIDLVTFSVSNMPVSGVMSFLDNSDPIAVGSGGVLDSFYNSNIDMTTTQDYFSGYAPGLESFNFDTLSTEDFPINTNSIKIYPNPTADYVYIDSNLQFKTIDVYDINGRRVARHQENLNQIDLRNLSGGVYFLYLIYEEKKLFKRIIKK